MAVEAGIREVGDAAERVQRDYGRDDSPLGGYLATNAVYVALSAGLLGLARARRVKLPKRISAGDLTLLAVATHKMSRTLAKDSVTSPLRAPFTRFKGAADSPGEVIEEVHGSGWRKAVGELLTCPFCLDQWVATGFVAGLVAAPRATRLIASTFAVRSGADLLHHAYVATERLANK
ncbi:MAG: hypothetical protein QOG53_1234 [Frankiales bacterium]|jgi:hypothetical protein|nr:hypothetical protein [Frankiales bacterium]